MKRTAQLRPTSETATFSAVSISSCSSLILRFLLYKSRVLDRLLDGACGASSEPHQEEVTDDFLTFAHSYTPTFYRYLAAVLRQDAAWFDAASTGALTTKLTE